MEPQAKTEETTKEAIPEQPVTPQDSGAPLAGIDNNKLFGILGYLIPIIFFVPLINEKTKNIPYVRFHANQQLILLIIAFAAYFLQNFMYMMFLSIGVFLFQAVNLGLLALAIIGAINAYKGEMTELPFVGTFRILK